MPRSGDADLCRCVVGCSDRGLFDRAPRAGTSRLEVQAGDGASAKQGIEQVEGALDHDDRRGRRGVVAALRPAVDPRRPARLTWSRQLALSEHETPGEHQSVPGWAREIRSRRDGVERMLVERGDDLPWRLRESISRLRAFVPDPGLDEDFENIHG